MNFRRRPPLPRRGGLPFFVGGILAWWIVSPIAFHIRTPTFSSVCRWPMLVEIYGRWFDHSVSVHSSVAPLMNVVVRLPPSIKSAVLTGKRGGGRGAGGTSWETSFHSGVLIAGTIIAVALFWHPFVSPVGKRVSRRNNLARLHRCAGLRYDGHCMALISVTLMMFLLNKPSQGMVGGGLCNRRGITA